MLGLDLNPRQSAAGGAEALERRPAGGVCGLEQILALGDEAAGALTRTASHPQLANLFEPLVVGACDGHRRKNQ